MKDIKQHSKTLIYSVTSLWTFMSVGWSVCRLVDWLVRRYVGLAWFRKRQKITTLHPPIGELGRACFPSFNIVIILLFVISVNIYLQETTPNSLPESYIIHYNFRDCYILLMHNLLCFGMIIPKIVKSSTL